MMDFGGGARRQNKKLWILLTAAGIVIILLAGLAGFLFWQNVQSKESQGEAKSKEVIAKVGDLFILPKNEEPTVAEIQELDKLKGQAFFDNAKNGDYVLIYTKAKVAFLYRESEGKLVNVGPIQTQADTSGQTQGAGQ